MEERIAGAEADGLLLERDRLLYRPGEELALSESMPAGHYVAIQRESRLVFRSGLRISPLRAQYLGSGEMRLRVAGQRHQGLPREPFRARDIATNRGGPSG